MALRVIPDSDETSLTSEKAGDFAYTDSYKVVSTTPNPGLVAVQAAVGVYVGNPGRSGTVCRMVRVRGSDDRYLFRVTAEFSRREKIENPLLKDDKFSWTASLNGTRPFLMALGDPNKPLDQQNTSIPDGTAYCFPCVNAALDPIEGLTMETAEARLRITGARPAFPASLAMTYVGSTNKKAYAGGKPYTWKCMSIEGVESEADIDDGTGSGNTTKLEYWQVTVDLAYRAEGWATEAFDVGYNEIVTVAGKETKRKICVPRVEKIPGWADGTDLQKSAWVEQYRASDVQALYSYDSTDPAEQAKAGQAKPEGVLPTTMKLHGNIAREWTGIFPQPPA